MTRWRPLFVTCLTVAASAQTPPPQIIFTNGNFHTLSAAQPRADTIGVAFGKIVAVGSAAEVLPKRQQETRVIDLGGKTVLPGLIDAHGHMAGLGAFALGRLDLSAAKSFDDVIQAVTERAAKAQAGEWILGGRWDHESWPNKALPTHAALSKAAPEHPVWLRRVDGHAGVANAAAMKLAGITKDTPSPAGGDIVHDAAGEPTGVFIDNAMSLITKHLPADDGDPAKALLAAQELCLSAGLTGVHDAGCSPSDVVLYKQLVESGQLKLRIYAMINGSTAVQYFRENEPLTGERLTVRACKLVADGAMGSRGAWLLEPYDDRRRDERGEPYVGLSVMKPAFLRLVAEEGLRRGFQVCTHAIGDRANRETLDAYEYALQRKPTKDHRYRIEHAQLLSPQDVPRFAALSVLASMQPTHCTSDLRWVEARVGTQRAAGAYAWASLLRSGVRIAGGSDFPVESHNPMLGLYAAVTRQDADGKPAGGWHAEQRMTRAEALRAFTLDAAYAAFEENSKGTLDVGKLADFVVVDRDPLTCDAAEIATTQVLRTVIGGETVFERK